MQTFFGLNIVLLNEFIKMVFTPYNGAAGIGTM